MAYVSETATNDRFQSVPPFLSLLHPSFLQFDREHFSEVFVDLKWFESKVGNKYLNEAAGLAAEKEAASKDANKEEVCCYVYMHRIYIYALTEVQRCFHVQFLSCIPVINQLL